MFDVDPTEAIDKPDGKVENHCPFGCPDEVLDEHGYCLHLVGFTNDGKLIEPLQMRKRKDPEDKTKWIEDGYLMVNGKMPELKQEGDRLVNPIEDQKVNGIVHKNRKWVSSRVYNEDLDREPIPTSADVKVVTTRSMPDPAPKQRAAARKPKEAEKGKKGAPKGEDKNEEAAVGLLE